MSDTGPKANATITFLRERFSFPLTADIACAIMTTPCGDWGAKAEGAVADFVYEIACTGDRAHEQAVHDWAERHAAPAWTALPGLSAVDLYEPVRGGTHDPFNDDGPGPLLMAMLQFPTREKLQAGLSDPRFKQSLAGMPVAATGTGFERRFFPVADAPNPGPLRAPFSYVVRYHHPAENVAEFVSHYVADHPPILGKLPADPIGAVLFADRHSARPASCRRPTT